MGRLKLEGDELILRLSRLEKFEGMHGDIRVPASSVRHVRSAPDPWKELRGIRAPGTGFPRLIAVGTRRGPGFKDFAVVHGRGPAVVVELEGAEYERLVVTQADADSAARKLAGELRLD